MEKEVKAFLEFRSRFTKRQWFELNQAVEQREKEKADKIQLDDLDINLVAARITKTIG